MAFLWTFEPQLDLLHPTRSRNGYCRKLRMDSVLAHAIKERKLTPLEGLEAILRAKTVNHIVDLMTSPFGVRLGYNIKNLSEGFVNDKGMFFDEAEVSKKTIEFRQHEGTMNPKRIRDWVELCVGLVDFANVVHGSTLEIFCKEHINDKLEDFSVTQVIAAAGLPHLAFKYGYKIANDAWQVEQKKKGENGVTEGETKTAEQIELVDV